MSLMFADFVLISFGLCMSIDARHPNHGQHIAGLHPRALHRRNHRTFEGRKIGVRMVEERTSVL